MFERFTDRARRVVVLAQEEARMLSHNYIGTEHILLGLILEGEGVAAKALESLGISLEAVRQQVEEIIGQGQQAPSGHIPFTPRAKKVLELSLREALQLGHKYIGTEHILLGLIREGEGVAAQVLVRLGADLNRVRQQVIQLLHGYQGKEPPVEMVRAGGRRGRKLRRAETALASLSALSARMLAMERRLGAGPDTSDLDRQIAEVRRDKEMALAAEAYERAADLRDRERRLIDERLARVREWEAANPGLAGLAEQVRQLSGEVTRLKARLGIPEDDTEAEGGTTGSGEAQEHGGPAAGGTAGTGEAPTEGGPPAGGGHAEGGPPAGGGHAEGGPGTGSGTA